MRHRLQDLVLLLIVSWPQLKGCNRCSAFHLHILSQTCFTLSFFLVVVSSGFVVALAIIIFNKNEFLRCSFVSLFVFICFVVIRTLRDQHHLLA